MKAIVTKVVGKIVVVAIICVAVIYIAQFFFKPDKDSYSLENINVSELESILQIRALQVNESCIVDSIKEGVIYNDKLTRTYEGTVNIGIDFADLVQDWATKQNGRVFINCPCLKILNVNGWVITNSKTAIEDGTWTNRDIKEVDYRANEVLKKKAMQRFPEAENNLRSQLAAKLKSMGYTDFEITFCK